MLRFLTAPTHALNAMAKALPSRSGPLTLRFLTGLARTLQKDHQYSGGLTCRELRLNLSDSNRRRPRKCSKLPQPYPIQHRLQSGKDRPSWHRHFRRG